MRRDSDDALRSPDHAFADGDVKEVALHMPTIYDLPDAPMVEDAINQITEENTGFI